MKSVLVALTFSCATITLAHSPLAQAQAIEVGELGQAQAYEPGTLSTADGGLDSGLWSGTEASTAISLINDTPDYYFNPVAQNMVRGVLLSAGVPPTGASDGQFSNARMNGIIRLSEMAAAQDIAQRSPGLASSGELRADLALLAGNVDIACQQSDSVIEGRTEPYWMKVRAFCHVERGEGAAAELTMNLLTSAGHEDVYFQRLIRHLTGVPGRPDLKGIPHSPLHIAMMTKADLDWPVGEKPATAAAQAVYQVSQTPEARLLALFEAAPALSDTQIQAVIEGLNSDPLTSVDGLAGGAAGVPATPSLDLAMGDKGARGFAQLYQLAQFGTPETRTPAIIEFLKRAEAGGSFPRFAEFIAPQLSSIDYPSLTNESVPLVTRAAILRRDLGALQQIYQSLEGNVRAQDRVALAADALGNGFYAGNLGTDIDTRLTQPGEKTRAMRDTLLAYGLGANLSDTALGILKTKASLGRYSGELFALESASRRRAQAETALRAAILIESYSKDSVPEFVLYKVVESLYQAGLTDQAAQLAALDFVQPLTE